MKTSFAACAALVLGPMLAGTAHAQSLRLVENLLVYDASRDGSVLVGTDQNFSSVRWTQSGGKTVIYQGNGFDVFSNASVVSADGGIVGGRYTDSQGRTRLFRWQGPGTFENLGNAGALNLEPLGIADNGRTMVGTYRVSGGYGAFRWTPETGIRALPLGQDGEAVAITGDGRTYAGSVLSGGRSYAITSIDGTIHSLPIVPDWTSSRAYNMCSNGNFVVGFCGRVIDFQTTLQACVWRDEVPQLLGTLSGYNNSIAHSISNDGSIITGICSNVMGPVGEDDFVWTASTGMIGFTAYARVLGYVIPPDYTYSDVEVTRDGSMVYGRYNRFEGGRPVAFGTFMMPVPAPGVSSVFAMSLLSISRRQRRMA